MSPLTESTRLILARDYGGDEIFEINISGTNYRVHKYTTVGTWTFTARTTLTIEYLVVAGGGGGGGTFEGGGGGAGGFLTGSASLSAQSYSISVGSGGFGRNVRPGTLAASNGNNSSIGGIATATGGGNGGSDGQAASSGGSGGGAAWNGIGVPISGGSNTVGQGFKGGDMLYIVGAAAGGGGAGGAAADLANSSSSRAGGSGATSSITGSAITYAAGGAGINRPAVFANGASGAVNTGNGGAGGGSQATGTGTGGNGGSGIVIVRYAI
jgi:hypothetical protein